GSNGGSNGGSGNGGAGNGGGSNGGNGANVGGNEGGKPTPQGFSASFLAGIVLPGITAIEVSGTSDAHAPPVATAAPETGKPVGVNQTENQGDNRVELAGGDSDSIIDWVKQIWRKLTGRELFGADETAPPSNAPKAKPASEKVPEPEPDDDETLSLLPDAIANGVVDETILGVLAKLTVDDPADAFAFMDEVDQVKIDEQSNPAQNPCADVEDLIDLLIHPAKLVLLLIANDRLPAKALRDANKFQYLQLLGEHRLTDHELPRQDEF